MRNSRTLLIPLVLLGAGIASAQPTVSAVVNAASNALAGLPNAAIAQGSMFVVYGKNIGPSTLAQVSSFPLPIALSGTSTKITVAGTTVDGIMVYTVATQIAAVLPSNTPTGTGTITVTYNGQTSPAAPITVVPSSFGTFTVNQAGSGAGIITYADYSLVTLNKAANPGETLLIWGTGLGPVSGNEAGGPLPGDQTSIPAEVWLGSVVAKRAYAGRSGCCTGLDQIAFVVPPGITGCNVPVAVKINDKVSNFSTMSIAASGRVCSDPGGSSGTELLNLFSKPTVTIGSVGLSRSTSISDGVGGFGGGTTKSDDGSASFFKITVPPGQVLTSLFQTTTIGACVVTTFSGQNANPFSGLSIKALDAGASISITGPSGNRTLTKTSVPTLGNIYSAKLGDTSPGNYLDPGSYTVAGPGGPDVGTFNVALTVPPSLVWTNQNSITTVTRANGQPITWTGGDPNGYVDISGSSFVGLTSASAVIAVFNCRAKTSDGSFTIPPLVLLSLPPSTSISGFAIPGGLSVGTSTVPKNFTATGLDYAVATSSVDTSKSVTYQ